MLAKWIPQSHFTSRRDVRRLPTLRKLLARGQWLTPVILATQEAEIRGISANRRANSSGDTISKKKKTVTEKWLVAWLKHKSSCLSNVRP
jgi:hypothetical protein